MVVVVVVEVVEEEEEAVATALAATVAVVAIIVGTPAPPQVFDAESPIDPPTSTPNKSDGGGRGRSPRKTGKSLAPEGLVG